MNVKIGQIAPLMEPQLLWRNRRFIRADGSQSVRAEIAANTIR
jgi:hypothetical protein